MKYIVRVTEELTRNIVVEASSTEDAENKVFDAHQGGKISLDYDNYSGVVVECVVELSEKEGKKYKDMEDF